MKDPFAFAREKAQRLPAAHALPFEFRAMPMTASGSLPQTSLTPRFASFVILADMRTGSNLLQSYLSAVPGVVCHGELFNPSFIDQPGQDRAFGIDLALRDADPLRLLEASRQVAPLTGFRLFSDHDPRVWDHVLADPTCGKIVLSRNPFEMYLSFKLAQATDQWRIFTVARRKTARVRFDPEEFAAFVDRLHQSRRALIHRLQTSGQTAFFIHYDDLTDRSVINGLLAWLGLPPLAELPRVLKKQNPEPPARLVENPDDLHEGVRRIDWFALSRLPHFEPRRPPILQTAFAAPRAPVLFLALRGSVEGELVPWLTALDGEKPEAVLRGFDPMRLRAWREGHARRVSFTIVRHPLLRAYLVFTRRVLTGDLAVVRDHLVRLFGLSLPKAAVGLSVEEMRAGFLAYLRFCKASLSGQTGLQPWPAWASQAALLEALAEVGGPDHVLHEERLAAGLRFVAAEAGCECPLLPDTLGPKPPVPVQAVLDEVIVAACKDAYARDFERFGFVDWPELG